MPPSPPPQPTQAHGTPPTPCITGENSAKALVPDGEGGFGQGGRRPTKDNALTKFDKDRLVEAFPDDDSSTKMTVLLILALLNRPHADYKVVENFQASRRRANKKKKLAAM